MSTSSSGNSQLKLDVLDGQVQAELERLRQIADEYRKQQHFFREVIDLNPNFIFAKDRMGRFTLVNKAVAEAYGTTVSELVGKRDADFNQRNDEVSHFVNDDLEVMNTLREKLIAEEKITDASGKVRWLQTVKRPLSISGNRAEQVLGVATDISERKQFEKTLTEIARIVSSSTGQQLFDSIVCYITKSLGFYCASISEFDGQKDTSLSTLAFAIRGILAQNFSYHIEGTPCADVTRHDVCCYPTAVSKRFPKFKFLRDHQIDSYLGLHLLSASGTSLGILMVCDQRPLENKERSISLLTILASRVATEIEARKNELNRLDLEAQLRHAQKLESLGVLAGGIAHDFNNLLVGVLGNAALVLSDLPENSSAADKVRKIKISAERAAGLTQQLLAYSGKGKFIKQALNLTDAVFEMGELAASFISKKASIHYLCNKKLPEIEADPTQVRQVIMNLITNASDALGSRAGKIEIETGLVTSEEARKFSVSVGEIDEKEKYVFMKVSDTGEGMDSETVARMFDPFFTTKFAGRGLGLSAVLGIVRGHKGAIHVESSVGVGTSIYVFFPVAQLAPEYKNGRKLEESQLAPNRSAATVLVVDDEPTVREVTTAVLEKNGFRVLAAEDGVEGLKLFEENLGIIDLAVIDMTMPRMSGDELLAEIRKLDKGMPVLLSSGYSEHEHHNLLTSDSFLFFLQKPFLPNDLLAAVEETLQVRKPILTAALN